MTQYGSGTLTLNASGTTYGTLGADNGTVVLAGTATIGVGSSGANYGGTLTLTGLARRASNRTVCGLSSVRPGCTSMANGESNS